MYRITDLVSSQELYHHGIKGQKWGIRRFQKKDGSLTSAGRKRYKGDMNDRASMRSIYMDQKVSERDRKTAQYGMKSKREQKKITEKWAKDQARWNGEEYSKDKAKEQYKKLRQEIADLDRKYPKHNNGKSDKQLQYEEMYMRDGVKPKEAETIARQRLKAEAFVAAAGVLALTGGFNKKANVDAIENGNFAPLIQKAAVAYAVYSAMSPKDEKNKR